MRRSLDVQGQGVRGIALILISGITTALALFALIILWAVRLLSQSGEAIRHAALANLSGSSGIEYGLSRVSADPFPEKGADIALRGDDWTFRSAERVPLEAAPNPSYSHGERWQDVDVSGSRRGVFEANVDSVVPPAWHDRDGDGRFSAWTGRLRGGGASGARFSLRIESGDGKIPLNAGYVDTGRSNVATCHPYQRALAHVLNSLGALETVLPAGHPRRLVLAIGGHDLPYSSLGSDLIAARPEGGYRSWDEAVRLLSGSGAGLGYTEEEIRGLSRFADLGPYAWQAEGGRAPRVQAGAAAPPLTLMPMPPRPGYASAGTILMESSRAPWNPPSYAPISMAAAPREVLESLWSGLFYGFSGLGALQPAEAAGWGVPAFWSGGAATYGGFRMRIVPEEARRLADLVLDQRGGADFSEWSLRREIIRRAPELFLEDFQALSAWPLNQRTYVNAKADLAFWAVSANPYPFDPLRGGAPTWEGWGIDRDGDGSNGIQQGGYIPFERIHDPAGPIAPQGFTMAPPARFSIASASRSRRATASFEIDTGDLFKRIDLTTQEDFENLAGGKMHPLDWSTPTPYLFRLADRRALGIETVEDPSADLRFDVQAAGGRPPAPRVVSLPRLTPRLYMRPYVGGIPPWEQADGLDNDADGEIDEAGEWNSDGIDDDRDVDPTNPMLSPVGPFWIDGADFTGEPNHAAGVSRCYGALGLATLEHGLLEADGGRLYWPFTVRHRHDYFPHFAAEHGASLPIMPMPVSPMFPSYRFRCWTTPAPHAGGAGTTAETSAGQTPYGGSMQVRNAETANEPWPVWPVKGIRWSGAKGTVQAASIEGWIWEKLRVVPARVPSSSGALIEASVSRGADAATRRGTVGFQLRVNWPTATTTATPALPARLIGSQTWTFSEDEMPGWPHHVLVTIERFDDGATVPWTELRLHVNGQGTHPRDGEMKLEIWKGMTNVLTAANRNGAGLLAYAMKESPPGQPQLNIDTTAGPGSFWALPCSASIDGDEMRMYDRAVAPDYAGRGERFPRSAAAYTSPLYVPQEPLRLERSQWLALVPPSFSYVPVRVLLTGYADAAGTSVATGFPVELSAGEIVDRLSRLPEVRSFRYEVRFDTASAAPPLLDTPVFESIWIAFRTRARPPWRRWSAG